MNKILYSSERQDWGTPWDFFTKLDQEFHFDLDCCASAENAKVSKYYTEADNALIVEDWEGSVIWCNPPYETKSQNAFVKKCYEESLKGKTVVMLIPARTDTQRWHEYIFPFAYDVRFLRGRLKFQGAPSTAPFPSALVIFKKPLDNLEETC